MKECKWCGKSFDPAEAADVFEIETVLFEYSNFNIDLCDECAIEAIEDEVDGIYFEICEECGRTFDWFEALGQFTSNSYHSELEDYRDFCEDRILCYDCASELE